MTAAALRKKARMEKDGRVAVRLLGIANILDAWNAPGRIASLHRPQRLALVCRFMGGSVSFHFQDALKESGKGAGTVCPPCHVLLL